MLKRLSQTIADNKKLKSRTAAQVAGDLDEAAIKKLILQYAGSLENTHAANVLKGILNADDEEDDLDDACMICEDMAEQRVFLPGCLHSGCKLCVLKYFEEATEAGDEVS